VLPRLGIVPSVVDEYPSTTVHVPLAYGSFFTGIMFSTVSPVLSGVFGSSWALRTSVIWSFSTPALRSCASRSRNISALSPGSAFGAAGGAAARAGIAALTSSISAGSRAATCSCVSVATLASGQLRRARSMACGPFSPRTASRWTCPPGSVTSTNSTCL
jgi:hypothetical protein